MRVIEFEASGSLHPYPLYVAPIRGVLVLTDSLADVAPHVV